MFWWNLFGFDCKSDTGTRSDLENRHLWSERKKQIFIRTYQYQHIKYHSIHNMLNRWIWNIQYNCSYLNNFKREIRTTAIISIATHAATSWLEIVKNTLGNFYAGGVMINPRYQSVVHAGDRSKDVLSVPWTRWVSPNHQISKNIFSRGMWSILYVIIARNRFWTILILSALMMENHIANIITTNFLAILAHGADVLFSLR